MMIGTAVIDYTNHRGERAMRRIQPLASRLSCSGVGRDKDNLNALQFYFNRPVTDDEMRFMNEMVKRAVACMPVNRR